MAETDDEWPDDTLDGMIKRHDAKRRGVVAATNSRKPRPPLPHLPRQPMPRGGPFGHAEWENAPAPSAAQGGTLPSPGDIEAIIMHHGPGPYGSDQSLQGLQDFLRDEANTRKI